MHSPHQPRRPRRRSRDEFARSRSTVAELELPEAVYKTCPWEPRELIETGLRQWLRCCAAALRDRVVIGMPSHAVDEAWHGLILCTARYQTFCDEAYRQFMHHHPAGAAPAGSIAAAEPMDEQVRRTVIAWELVALPGEHCVLWDLDRRVGVADPWGIDSDKVDHIRAAAAKIVVGKRV